MNFKDYWELEYRPEEFRKSGKTLSKKELVDIQQKIAQLQKRGYSSTKIIKYLQNHNNKLVEKWQAERAFWTELKDLDTTRVHAAAAELGITRYKAILSPDACPICVGKTRHGVKIFDNDEMTKGAGSVPPFHPNCYCIMVPVA